MIKHFLLAGWDGQTGHTLWFQSTEQGCHTSVPPLSLSLAFCKIVRKTKDAKHSHAHSQHMLTTYLLCRTLSPQKHPFSLPGGDLTKRQALWGQSRNAVQPPLFNCTVKGPPLWPIIGVGAICCPVLLGWHKSFHAPVALGSFSKTNSPTWHWRVRWTWALVLQSAS